MKNFLLLMTGILLTGLLWAQEAPSGIQDYKRIKAKYDLFGKWEVCSPCQDRNDMDCYAMEIYNMGNNYVSFKTEGNYSAALLERNGNKFVFTTDGFGLYFIIQPDKTLTMFTPEGRDLSTLGYEVSTID